MNVMDCCLDDLQDTREFQAKTKKRLQERARKPQSFRAGRMSTGESEPMNNKVTKRQHEYLKAIEGNPQSSIELAEFLGTTRHSTWKMLNRLRNNGLIVSEGSGRATTYRLHQELRLETLEVWATTKNAGKYITDEEKAFAVGLRESGLVGQRLHDKYRETYPERSPSGIDNVIGVIRREGCR